MNSTHIHLEDDATRRQFRTAVSLHSHTLYSRETMSFVDRLASQFAPLRAALRRGASQYSSRHGCAMDLSRAWWTPPADPVRAWRLERNQIEHGLGLKSLVSITDHDSIDAPLSLRACKEATEIPVSVEWTVPYGPTFFHLGIHNLPPERSREIMSQLAAFTAAKGDGDLTDILQALSARKETLVVFNHPCWDENGIGREPHILWATRFAHTYRPYLHAFELNGLRPWPENRAAIRFAREMGMPIISGGDRHAMEPNTILDLTNATTFAEYVEQVRSGRAEVLVMKQYREPFSLRILQNLEEIMQDHENHSEGWRRWSDRVFYRCDDGEVRSLTKLFERHVPTAVQCFVGAIDFMRTHSLRRALRFALSRPQELSL